MPATFGDVIRECQLTAAAVPALLIRQWAFDAYAELLSGSRWGWQRETTEIRPTALRAAAIVLSPGSATVTSAALFLATDVGKQIRIAGEPLLFITAFVSTSQVTLSGVYLGTSTAVTASILDTFYTPPSSFQQWVEISDVTRECPVPWWLTLEEIRLWDPGMRQVGTPRALFAVAQRTPTGEAQKRATYAWWPLNTTGGVYTATYLRSPQLADLTDETALPDPLADRAYVLKKKVLANCAQFPGTPGEKNPYFNLSLATQLLAEYTRGRHDLSIVDDDQTPTQVIDTIDWSYVRTGRKAGDAYLWSDASAVGYGSGSWGYY